MGRIPVGATDAPSEILLVSTPSAAPISKRFDCDLADARRPCAAWDLSVPQRRETTLMVEERTVSSGRIADDRLGDHDPVVARRDARHHAADQPRQHSAEHRHSFRPVAPIGGRAEPVGAAARECGGQFLLVLAEYVYADMLGLRHDRPAGRRGPHAEGDQRRLGGDGVQGGGGEADRPVVEPR